MKVWERALAAMPCGACERIVAAGTPVLRIRLDGLQRRLVRCESCAEGPVDLDQLEQFDVAEEGKRAIAPPPQQIIRRPPPVVLPFDPKMAAAGERQS